MNTFISEADLNEYGHFDMLKEKVEREKTKLYFESLEVISLAPFKIIIRIDVLLKEFILKMALMYK